MDSAYFDSSVFLAIFNGEPTGPAIKSLLREFRRDHNKVCTSIITVQEVSVLSYSAGIPPAKEKLVGTDNYSKVDRLARIHGITKDIALLAAKLEALMIERMRRAAKDQRLTLAQRRKWDCFHIATAIEMRCRWLYSLDPGMLKCKDLISSVYSLTFSEPRPSTSDLFEEGKGIHIQ